MPHTPGPWTVHLHTGEMDGEAHINADGCCIAYVGFGTETERHYVTGEEAKANARLMRAALELYEYVASSAAAGCATARSIIDKLNLDNDP